MHVLHKKYAVGSTYLCMSFIGKVTAFEVHFAHQTVAAWRPIPRFESDWCFLKQSCTERQGSIPHSICV